MTVGANETAATLTVTATSTFDNTKSGTATVTVETETSSAELFFSDFKIYPNPFTGEVRITGATTELTRGHAPLLKVIDAAGPVVHTQMITSADETIRLEHLPAGVYFFLFEKDGKTKTAAMIKN